MEKATQRQIEYAQDIHNALGYELPAEDTKIAYMKFLDKYVPEYKEMRRLEQIEHEAYLDSIDARRDW